MTSERKAVRALIATIGLDGHDIGIRVVSSFLVQIGVEVVYLGTYQTPESVVASAIQEDVDTIGLSFLAGDHLEQVSKVQSLLKSEDLSIPVIVGNQHPPMVPHNNYRCKGEDSWVSIAVANDSEWECLCCALGDSPWTKDTRFADRSARLRN